MKKTKKAYSVMVALLMIGFLLITVVGVFNLVLKELNDNRGMGKYYKSFFGAEAGQELALLQIKKHGYGYCDKIDLSVNDRSIVLAKNYNDKSLFKGSKDIIISYNLDLKSNNYFGSLENLKYDIIPLFYIDSSFSEKKVKNISLKIDSGDNNDLVWNIIGKNRGISGVGDFDGNSFIDEKINTSLGLKLTNKKIKDFLLTSQTNYLVILNSGNSKIEYNLKTINNGEYFSKPRVEIFSSSKIGNFKQNLSTDFDNTEYLGFLKYSLYSE